MITNILILNIFQGLYLMKLLCNSVIVVPSFHVINDT